MTIEWSKPTRYIKLLALAIFIAMPFLGFYLGMQYGERMSDAQYLAPQIQNVAPTPVPPVATSSIDTSSWRTYRNDTYGFQIKYPPTLTLEIPQSPEHNEVTTFYEGERYQKRAISVGILGHKTNNSTEEFLLKNFYKTSFKTFEEANNYTPPGPTDYAQNFKIEKIELTGRSGLKINSRDGIGLFFEDKGSDRIYFFETVSFASSPSFSEYQPNWYNTFLEVVKSFTTL